MSDRATVQLEHDLDVFWNELVIGPGSAGLVTPEMAMVAQMAALETAPKPRVGFLDELWTQMLESDGGDAPLPEQPQPIAPIAPAIVPLPTRREHQARSGYRRWASYAAAVAALLAIAAVSAVLFVDRRSDGSPALGAQRWTMSGGGPGKTNSNPDATAFSEPHVQWRVETEGRIEGVPVVSDGVVFIGNQEHHMYALDTETGMQRWDANLRKPIVGSAAVGDSIVVVGTTTSLFGLDEQNGAVVWQRDDLVAGSDPAIVGGAVYLVDDESRLRSLELATGRDRWISEPAAETPGFAIDGRSRRIYVAAPGGGLHALATADGSEIWEADPGPGLFGTPLVDGDDVVVSIPGGVERIDGETGELGLSNVVGFESYPSVLPALALSGDLLFASTEQLVLAYEPDTLEVAWVNQELSGLTGDMTVGANTVYLTGKDRTLVALDLDTGELQWSIPLDEVAHGAPAVTSDGLFISTRAGSVYAIGGERSSILNAPVIETGSVAGGPVTALWKSSGGPNALRNPTGIAVSPSGEVWVCDTANDRLQIFDSDGNFLREFGSHGSQPGQFDFGEETAEMDGHVPLGNACSLAFDASGALYVADAANFRIQRFPASAFGWMANACCTIRAGGTYYPFPASGAQPDLIVGTEGTGAGQFLFPSDVAVAPNGDVYVGDRLRLDVQRFDANGTFLETIGKPVGDDPFQAGTFLSLNGIAIDGQGRLSIVDGDSQEVDRLESDGSWSTIQLTREDYRINGIAVDEFGNVFVAQINSFGGSFSIYGPDGTLLERAGTHGTGLGQFDGTTGLALDGLGNVYATDWGMNRFQKFAIDYQQLTASGAESGSG